jgi:hypothetical protein
MFAFEPHWWTWQTAMMTGPWMRSLMVLFPITRCGNSFSFLRSLIVLLALVLFPTASKSATVSADTVVLVNSASTRYLDFRNYLQPYLDHFGIPYSVLDVRTNEVGANIADYALIVVGHAQFDTNHLYFSPTEQSNVVQAVAAGVGLVNFDSVLSGSGMTTNYQYVQDIFGFSYPGGSTGNFVYSANFFATELGGQLHYIIARHPTNTTIAYRAPINLLNVNAPANVKVLSRSGGQPLVSATTFGQGRAVQWGSYDWVNMDIKGPLGGLDDVVWRGLIWAARKPFVMRGLPNLVSLRVDDTVGPSWWVGVANEVGLKPWLGAFVSSMPVTNIAELRDYATNGLCTVSPHSFTPGDFVYWNHSANTNWSDTQISNRMYSAQQWHLTNGLPLSKVIVPHTYEVGLNAFPWFQQWGSEFFIFDNEPGTPSISQWLVAGPFRKYVPTRSTANFFAECYADFLNIPGHPELAGAFFNSTTVIQDDSPCGEWCPDNDVAGTVGRGVRQLKRAFDSLAQGVLYTHEARIQYNAVGPVYTPSITTNNWRTILQTITNQLAEYQPQYVTLDYSCQYVRATRTAKITAAVFEPASGQMSMTFTGSADLNLTAQVYVGADNAITNVPATVPAFTNSVVVNLPVANPLLAITNQPQNQTVLVGTNATFTVGVTGSAPFGYQWLFNNTNFIGATDASLVLPVVQPTDAGNYAVVITNVAGAVTSSVVMLTVLAPPDINNQPQSQTVIVGSNASFTVSATGTAPLGYQWQFNSTDIVDATNVTYSLAEAQTTNAGVYAVVVSNLAGSILSSNAVLSVLVPPAITNQPQDLTVVSGTNVVFAVGVTGSAPLGYQWQKDNTNIEGAVADTYELIQVQPKDAGNYSVLVSNAAGAATSVVSVLTVILPEPPVLSGYVEGNFFVITFTATPGNSYVVEYSDDLNAGSWLALTNLIATATDMVCHDTLAPTQRYYRVRLTLLTAAASRSGGHERVSEFILVFDAATRKSYALNRGETRDVRRQLPKFSAANYPGSKNW